MIYDSLLDISENFDTFLFDAFGVFNFGGPVSQSAIAVMAELVKHGKNVAVVSNSPRLQASSMRHYARQGLIHGTHYHHLFVPGQIVFDLARAGKLPTPGKKYFIAWELDAAHDLNSCDIFKGSDYEQVLEITDADFVICEFPTDDGILTTDAGVMTPMIEKIAAAGKMVICPNPDLHFLYNGEFVVAHGTVCAELEKRGVQVVYYGKPHSEIYDIALSAFPGLNSDRTLMIGDTLHTDILGATRAGIKSCLTLAHGISANDLQEPTEENIHAAATRIGARVDYIIKKVPREDL